MRHIIKSASPLKFETWKIANNPTTWEALQNAPQNPEEGINYYSKRDLQ